MTHHTDFPTLCQVVLDATDTRALAEFYRELLNLTYAPGSEPTESAEPDPEREQWLILRTTDDKPALAIQAVPALAPVTWPEGPVPQQLHLDLKVTSVEQLQTQHDRVLELGGRMLQDRKDTGPDEPVRVYADPAGHPFCIFVSED